MKLSSALLLIAVLLIAQFAFPQDHYEGSNDYKIGLIKRTDLQIGEFSKYFFSEYKNYSPEKEVIDLLKYKIFDCSITIVLGTWCSDSREQVPKLFRILDELDYNTEHLTIISVDKKKSAGYDISGLGITRVPTFIFIKDGDEKGRITETPTLTIEKDIYNILFE
jgi:thiol-disulfide isomerase/thioredoxin